MTTPPEPEGLSAEQRAGLQARNEDRDRTLEAMHVLEAALSRGAYGRADWWQQEVRAALGALEDVTTDEAASSSQPDSLLSQIAFSQPRLRNRVRGLRAEFARLRDAITALREQLDTDEDDDDAEPDVSDTRQRLSWLLGALRHHRARESDLIYEAYYDVFQKELDDG